MKLTFVSAICIVTCWMACESCSGCHRCDPTVTSYTDMQTFLTALGGTATIYRFDEFTHMQPITNQLARVTFTNAVAYDEQNHPSQGFWESAPNVLMNADGLGGNPIRFTFNGAVRGVGFFNTSIHDRERVTFESERCGVVFTGELPEGANNFLGVISSVPITSGQVVGVPPTNGSIFIDAFSFGDGNR